MGGGVGLLLIALLAATALFSRSTWQRRAKRQLIQDQVYNLVMGVPQTSPYSDDLPTPEAEPQVHSQSANSPRCVGFKELKTRSHDLCNHQMFRLISFLLEMQKEAASGLQHVVQGFSFKFDFVSIFIAVLRLTRAPQRF